MKFVMLKFNVSLWAVNYLFTVMKTFKQFWTWSVFGCEIIIILILSAKSVGLGLAVMVGTDHLRAGNEAKDKIFTLELHGLKCPS